VRIAQLSSMSGCYGGEVHLIALARGLHERGHEVWGVVRPGSELAVRLPRAGIPIKTLPLVDWYEPWGTLRLRAWLRRAGIDVLHSHLPRDWYTAAVASLGTPVVNVGTRQRHRERAGNVIDVPYDRYAIRDAIGRQRTHGRYARSTLYGHGRSGEAIARHLISLCRDPAAKGQQGLSGEVPAAVSGLDAAGVCHP
jgi:hypothetical protein